MTRRELSPLEREARAMPEKVLQEAVRRLAVAGGWRYYHTHRSQHSPAGFPDVCAIRGDVLLFAELKREAGKLSPEQEAWLGDLRHVADLAWHAEQTGTRDGGPLLEVHLWRPSDLLSGVIGRRLAGPPVRASSTTRAVADTYRELFGEGP